MSTPTVDQHAQSSNHNQTKNYVFLLLILVSLAIVYLVSKYTMHDFINYLPYVNESSRMSSQLESEMELTLRKTYKYLSLSEMYDNYSMSEDEVAKLKSLLAEVDVVNDEFWGLIRETNKKLMDYKNDLTDNTFIYWGIINEDISKQFESNVSKAVKNITTKLSTATTSGFENKLLPEVDSEYSNLLENAGIGASDISSHLQYIKNNADAYKNVTNQLISTTDHIENANPRLGLYAALPIKTKFSRTPLTSEPSELLYGQN